MKKTHIALAFILTAVSSLSQATDFPKIGSPCSNDGDISATDATALKPLTCSNKKWLDAATLDAISVAVSAKAERASAGASLSIMMSQTGYVGVPLVWSQTADQSYAAASSASGVQVGSLQTGLTVKTEVLGLNQDHTAHVSAYIDVMKATGTWSTHVDLNVPVGAKTVIGKDNDGVEYAITVGKRAS
jgi:hypothetical protein